MVGQNSRNIAVLLPATSGVGITPMMAASDAVVF